MRASICSSTSKRRRLEGLSELVETDRNIAIREFARDFIFITTVYPRTRSQDSSLSFGGHRGQWEPLHDNARPHTAIRVRQFLATRKVTVLEHPPDLAPVDFFLFPRFKGVLKVLRFSDIAQIQQRVTMVFRAIPKEAFADSFQQLYNRCQKCIVTNGDYFECQ
ncbi:hypothetical protein AVEN_197288-1 [Araneus ventricosus]|uniref:Histone-lysine N-methyltransferase SETMAR n=1 Tax=Araneus ventricosus TaxID=182803 RepID=A0A4Y2PHW2_ARAVE|nr:hypothetical protein AVEN_197288-1 [Araneus ventricosus]